jgi:hypothetical protein
VKGKENDVVVNFGNLMSDTAFNVGQVSSHQRTLASACSFVSEISRATSVSTLRILRRLARNVLVIIAIV